MRILSVLVGYIDNEELPKIDRFEQHMAFPSPEVVCYPAAGAARSHLVLAQSF